MTHSLRRTTYQAIRLAPYALLFLACFLRISSITFQSLWRDEVDAICFAQAPLIRSAVTTAARFVPACPPDIPSLLDSFSRPGWNGPLYFFMLRGWITIAGDSEFALRFPSLLAGVIGVALIVTAGTRLFNRTIGLIAGALLTFSAYHVWYSQEAKMYTLITLFALAAVYCLRRGVEDGRARFWIGVVTCTSLAMYAHILAVLLIPVEVILFVVWWSSSRKHITAGLIALAFLTVPYLPLALWQIPLAFNPAETGFPHYTLDQMLNVLGGAYALGILPLPSLTATDKARLAGLCVTLAVFGLLSYLPFLRRLLIRGWSRIRFLLLRLGLLPWREQNREVIAGQTLEAKEQRSSSLFLAAWLSIPIVAIYVISINRPVFTDRYLIWVMPAYYLLIALGLYALSKWLHWAAIVPLIILLFVSASSIGVQATVPYKPDFRSAAQAVAPHFQPDDAIIFQIPHVRYTFDYYFHQPHTSLDGPYTNYPGNPTGYRDSDETINQQLNLYFKDRRSVWLVASEVDLWDVRHLLQTWLDAHGTITFQADFTQVRVTRYELGP